ncbi:MAG: oxygen-independent coproporphyrinogen III oxidase [Gammaproteobacteria bacterium]|nr:oxygen-independent coproporphyrinogen III oxidase [Gammaproteobacteria bacterium]
MAKEILFEESLIRKYDTSGPRYTSYPTAVQFDVGYGEQDYRQALRDSNSSGRPLSLYFHVPFCNTVCFYCGCSKVVTKHRERAAPYLALVYQEMAMVAAELDTDRSVDQLHWGGGTPTFISHDEMRELMSVTRKHFNLHDDDTGEYSIEIDPRELDADTLPLLRELGFNRMSLGVQDFDPKVQKAVNRIQPEAVTIAALEQARALGFRSINLDLIYGLPFQSVASFSATLDRILEIRPDRLSVFNYAHLPEMFKPQRRINAEDLPSPAEKLAILDMAITKLTDAGYVYIGMDHFALPGDELAVAQREGTLYRNFQGYSTHAHCDLVGFGMTSIGAVNDHYAQNEKTEEGYAAAIQAGHLPIIRGLALSDDDCLRRKVITELICHFRLDFERIENAYQIRFTEYFADELRRLEPMQQDGLLELSDNGIQVFPAGKLLIRNICMIFDAYLRSGESGRFSKVI